MINPFDVLLERIKRLEEINQEVLNCLQQPSHAAPERGGIELAQEVTRLSKPRIYALVSARAIPHAKRGNKLYFNRADLLAWVAQGTRSGAPASSDTEQSAVRRSTKRNG
jgi:excisionase family DNA binding protein